MNDIILGTGLAGLLVFYYNQHATIIGDVIKGQMNSKFQGGPRLIQYDKNTYELCSGLFNQSRLHIKKIYIGYESGSTIPPELTYQFKLDYSFKTRGHRNVESSFLSNGRNETKVIVIDGDLANSLDILVSELVSIAYNSGNMSEDRVVSINRGLRQIELDRSGTIQYDNLYNTIPLDITNKLLSSKIVDDIELSRKNKHYYRCNCDNKIDIDARR